MSVTTGRGLDAIAAGAGADAPSKTGPAAPPEDGGASPARVGEAPGFVAPQLATLRADAPSGADWWQEPKFDGYRCLLSIGGNGIRAYSRNGHDWSDRFAALIGPAKTIPCDTALIDGEVTAGEGGGDFSTLQKALGNGDPLSFFAFDLLHLDGEDLRDAPLRERREALDALLGELPGDGAIRLSPHVEGSADEVLTHMCGAGAEGIICKRADAPYRSGRGADWIKVKCVKGAEFVIGGWSPSDKPGRAFASLLLGSSEDGRLVYRGRVGTGFDAQMMRDLSEAMAPMARKTPAFEAVPRDIARGAVWVRPELVAQIRYAELTADGQIRHGVFLGLREDKPAKEVSAAREVAVERGETEEGDPVLRGIRISSAGRVVYPGPGLTKGGIARYYDAIAERMMQHAADRPVALVRMPSGLDGQRFFQRHAGKGFPDAIGTVRLTEASGREADYITLPDATALLGAVQMGTLEVHIHGARNDRLDRPDRLVFDLDPDEGLAFEEVKRAAREMGDLMRRLGLSCAPMVTGGKGVHVVVPLRRVAGWETLRGFAQAVAQGFERRAPDRYTATMSKARREGRVFIDWLRNDTAATAISPYSLRARPMAPVAVPVEWEELDRLDRADGFDVEAAMARLDAACPLLEASKGAPGLSERTLDALEDWLEESA